LDCDGRIIGDCYFTTTAYTSEKGVTHIEPWREVDPCIYWLTELGYEVVIVDNDHKRSAEDIARLFQKNKDLHIVYECEPEQNILGNDKRRLICARRRLYVIPAAHILGMPDDWYTEGKSRGSG
jgi:hypothetical protein